MAAVNDVTGDKLVTKSSKNYRDNYEAIFGKKSKVTFVEPKTLNELEELTVVWGTEKGILPKPDKLAQFNKTVEEVEELNDAIVNSDREEAIDAIGDIIVTLIMQTKAWDTNLTECLEQAYNTISKRNGKMVDGVFVKDS